MLKSRIGSLSDRLKTQLVFLKENFGVIGVKTGTEVESFSFDEIRILSEIVGGNLPFYVKIGGCEARNDMLFLAGLGVDGIIAPMIESVYALKNFISSFRYCGFSPDVKPMINIETITAFNILDEMTGTGEFEMIKNITIGRSDFAASMNQHVDSAKVMAKVKTIIDTLLPLDKFISIGGKVTIDNSSKLLSMNSHAVNTRHLIISTDDKPRFTSALEKSLTWEIDLYKFLTIAFPHKVDFYDERIASIKKRLYHSPMVLNVSEG